MAFLGDTLNGTWSRNMIMSPFLAQSPEPLWDPWRWRGYPGLSLDCSVIWTSKWRVSVHFIGTSCVRLSMLNPLSYSPRHPRPFQRLLYSLLSQWSSENLWQGCCQLVYFIPSKPIPHNVLRIADFAELLRLRTRYVEPNSAYRVLTMLI